VNHAVRVTKGGVQYTFWGTLGFAPISHMHKSLGQRRNMVIDDLFQLKTDVDVFNDTSEEKGQQFELELNFTNDIAEREEIERMQNRRKDVA
jgi:Mg2+ and Co2+ transporter CorA